LQTDDVHNEEENVNDDPLHFLKRVFPDEVFETREGVSLAEFWDWCLKLKDSFINLVSPQNLFFIRVRGEHDYIYLFSSKSLTEPRLARFMGFYAVFMW